MGFVNLHGLLSLFLHLLVQFSIAVPCIAKDETDIAIRFINFIDNLYFHKTLLFISLANAPEKIYPIGKRAEEFKRTISRLNEMNSQSYFINSKHQ
jgi:cell division protein ZapE